MLQLQNVTKIYNTKAGEVRALDGVSLTFPTTGLIFITGKSGCGKTTLLNVIGGLDGIDSGEILIQDKKFSAFSASEYDNYRNTFIGFIFQEYNLLPEFTVEKNIKMAMELQGRKADEKELENLLKDMEIDDLKSRKPSELSGGQRQRVAIARALVKQPRIIMADEPTGALDSDTGIQVLDTLKKLSEKTLIIVVSHDWDFAEKYADRLIHLEDGKVTQDVTFTERNVETNVIERGSSLVVRAGSDLSEQEKDAVAKAVKTRKNIEIIERPSFRDKAPTGTVTLDDTESVSLRKSKMKMRSSVHMGVKSLVAKPVRLFFTILISALAFALFGVCDTIANFQTARVLKNQLKIAESPTVVITGDYTAEYELPTTDEELQEDIVQSSESAKESSSANLSKENSTELPKTMKESYYVKFSQDAVDELQSKTGGKVKGIIDLRKNYTGDRQQALSIEETASSTAITGKRYYARTINGFVEFDEKTEITDDGVFKDFGYKLLHGKYPKLDDGLAQDGVYQVAISTYLADSIIHYLDGKTLTVNGESKDIVTWEDLLDADITIVTKTKVTDSNTTTSKQKYKIVGIVDCGGIPDKYNEMQYALTSQKINVNLIDGFNAFINAGAHKCLFVPSGFLDSVRAKTSSADIFFAGKEVSLSISAGDQKTRTQAYRYVYNVDDYGVDNILLFDGNYAEGGEIKLADDEILVHTNNLLNLLASKIKELPTMQEEMDIRSMLSKLENGDMANNRSVLHYVFTRLGIDVEENPITATVYQRTVGETLYEKKVKIVGAYFGVDTKDAPLSGTYRFMMNTNLMDELGIYSKQGDYDKLLFSSGSIKGGGDLLVHYLLREDGLRFNWYNNSMLEVIRINETTIRDGAKLFMYADLALCLFAVFMLYNYMSTTIASKKQSVGILRALGAGKKDILRIFLSESLIVSVINGILATGLAALGCIFVNTYIVEVMKIPVHFALYGIRQILMISGITLLTGIASSTLPIVKISKKKPVELIRRS